MPLWIQHILVISAIGFSAAFVLRQGLLSLRGRKSKLSSCGSCGSCGAKTPSTPASPRTQFIPLESLGRRK